MTIASGQNSNQDYFLEPVDPSTFSTFSISPIRHNFNLHPLMQLDELEKLAHKLMETKQCRFVSPDIKPDSDFFHTSETSDGRSLSEVFQDIEKPGSWVALYNVEVQPEYQRFLQEVMEVAKPFWEQEQSGIFNIGGFIFISAPPSVTPFHIDRENNFWLQIKGQKSLSLFDNKDFDIVANRDVENFIIYRGLENVTLTDEIAARSIDFETRQGDGVYFPSTTPHMTRSDTDWVTSDDGVSISIGVVFYSDQSRKLAQVHQGNNFLRKFGNSPQPPGQSAWKDGLKSSLGYFGASLKARFRGYSAPPGAF